jgi:hypothetical protein
MSRGHGIALDEHAGRGDTITVIGYEDADARMSQGFLPDGLGTFLRLRDGTNLRHLEERNE